MAAIGTRKTRNLTARVIGLGVMALALAGARASSAWGDDLRSVAIDQSTAREIERATPIAADTHLDEAATPRGSVCRVMGTGRPYQSGCTATLVTVSSLLDGHDPVATVEPSRVHVRFDLLDTTDTAWAVAWSAGVRVSAYWPLARETFRLRREATALEGHAHLLVDTAVGVRWIARAGIAVHPEDPDFNLDDLDSRASCNALAYDPFDKEEKPAPEPKGQLLIPVGNRLPLFTTSTGPLQFVLQSGSASPLMINLQIAAHWDKRYLVDFRTAHARFDVWVDDKDVEPTGMPLIGYGSGLGCGTGYSVGQRHSTLLHAAWALVAVGPFEAQRSSIHLDKGTQVFVDKSLGEWTAVRPAVSAIQPPEGKSFWIPTSAI